MNTNKSNKANKSFLKWVGGKHSLIPFLKSNIQPFNNQKQLIECFAGSAVLSFNTEFESYVLSDINSDVINLFQQIKNEKQSFIEEAKYYFMQHTNSEAFYYTQRDAFNEEPLNTPLRALRFLYLNRHGFNGQCRYNASGRYNVAFGCYTKPYFPQQEMQHFISKADRFTLLTGDYSDALRLADTNTLVYFDPPYVGAETVTHHIKYQSKGFTYEDQQKLVKHAQALQAKGIPSMISNHDTKESRDLYVNATEIKEVEVKRKFSGSLEARKKAFELLAIYHPKPQQ